MDKPQWRIRSRWYGKPVLPLKTLLLISLSLLSLGHSAYGETNNTACKHYVYKFDSRLNLSSFDELLLGVREFLLDGNVERALASTTTNDANNRFLRRVLKEAVLRVYSADGSSATYPSTHVKNAPGNRWNDEDAALVEAVKLAGAYLYEEYAFNNVAHGDEAVAYHLEKWLSDPRPDHILYAAKIVETWSKKLDENMKYVAGSKPLQEIKLHSSYMILSVLNELHGVQEAGKYLSRTKKGLQLKYSSEPETILNIESKSKRLLSELRSCGF